MRSGITQKVPTGSPYIQIVVDGDTHTSEGGSGNDRLMKVTTDEQVYGGQYLIELDNADESLNSEDYTGKPLVLKWGYVGETQSTVHPLWVWSQSFLSREGKLLVQLNCVDIWAFIAAHNATLTNASYNQEWQQSDVLSTRYMADGSTLWSSGDPTTYAILVANGDKTILAILQDLLDTDALNITLDTDDYTEDSYINSLKPPISIDNARTGIRQLMDYTQSYLKWKTNGHLGIFKPAYHATVYTFNHMNTFYMEVDEAGVTIPNRVIFWSYDSAGSDWIHSDYASGYGVDSDSYSRIGMYIDRHYIVGTIDNNNMRTEAQLNDYADAALEKIQGQRNQGFIVAPMHCSLELFDKVQVNDDRYTSGGDRVVTGYVHRIIREYDRGVYRATVYLGGTVSGYTTPDGEGSEGLAEGGSPYSPSMPSSFPPEFLPAYLPAVIDIEFYITDYNTIGWYAGGDIKTADGSVFDINSGTKELTNSDVFYAYYNTTTDDGDLDWTQTFQDTVSHERILVGFFKRGSSTADDPLMVIGSQGQDLFVDKLSAITADMGLLNAGEIRVGTGTLGSDYTGWRLWVESSVGRMAGYNDDTIQWYSDTDGKLYAGAGGVVIDATGIHIRGDWLLFHEPTTPWAEVGHLYFETSSDILELYCGYHVRIKADSTLYLDCSVNAIQLGYHTEPDADNQYDLGDTDRRFRDFYTYDAYLYGNLIMNNVAGQVFRVPYATSVPSSPAIGTLVRNAEASHAEEGELCYYTNTGSGDKWYRCSLIEITWT